MNTVLVPKSGFAAMLCLAVGATGCGNRNGTSTGTEGESPQTVALAEEGTGGPGRQAKEGGRREGGAFPPDRAEAARSDEDRRHQSLRELCSKLKSAGESEQLKLLAQLKEQFPELHPLIVTLLRDEAAAKREEACTALAELGDKARGVAPVLIHTIDTARSRFGEYAGQQLAARAATALGRIAAENGEAVERLIVLSHEPDGKDEDGRPLSRSTVRAAAVVALADVAARNPPARPAVVAQALLPALKRKDASNERLAAARALGACSIAGAPALEELRAAENGDPSADIRAAATKSVAELERHVAVVPRLRQLQIVEGQVPPEVFASAFSLVEGKKGADEEALKVLRIPASDDATLRALLNLAGLRDAKGNDYGPARGVAVKLLSDAAEAHPALRPRVLPTLAAAMNDPASAELALPGLAAAGAEGVRHLRAAKAPLQKFEAYVHEHAWDGNRVRPAAVAALAELGGTGDAAVHLFQMALAADSTPELRRVSAGALARLGPADVRHAGPIRAAQLALAGRDAETAAALAKVLKGMDLDPTSEARYLASLLTHSKADERQKPFTTIARDMGAFAKEAGPEARKAFVQWYWQKYHNYQGLRDLTAHFRDDVAKGVVPLVEEAVAALEAWSRERRPALDELACIDALGAVGAPAGPKAKAALQDVVKFAVRKGKVQRYGQAHDKAVAALRSFDQVDAPASEPGVPAINGDGKADGFVSLFDGKDLAAWLDGAGNKSSFVEGGVLVAKPGGHLLSKQRYGDFQLRLEFLAASAGSYGALGFRVPSESDLGKTLNHFAVYLADENYNRGTVRVTGTLLHNPGDQNVLARAPRGSFKKVGEWNDLEVQLKGWQLQVTLNGKQVLNVDVGDEAKKHRLAATFRAALLRPRGPLMIVGGPGRIDYRNVRIRELK